jgi:hypothetical protein
LLAPRISALRLVFSISLCQNKFRISSKRLSVGVCYLKQSDTALASKNGPVRMRTADRKDSKKSVCGAAARFSINKAILNKISQFSLDFHTNFTISQFNCSKNL